VPRFLPPKFIFGPVRMSDPELMTLVMPRCRTCACKSTSSSFFLNTVVFKSCISRSRIRCLDWWAAIFAFSSFFTFCLDSSFALSLCSLFLRRPLISRISCSRSAMVPSFSVFRLLRQAISSFFSSIKTSQR
jgi:hypothetical protein